MAADKANDNLHIFIAFTWFALLFYGIALFYGAQQNFQRITPWYLLIVRDVVFIGLLLYFACTTESVFSASILTTTYKNFLKKFLILIVFYLGIVCMHLFHRDIRGIIQHDIRNIVLYSLFLPFLPIIFEGKETLDILVKNILYAGLVLSLFGIITRYTAPKSLTWNYRIISTMADPNNLAVFLSLCMFIVVCKLKSFRDKKLLLFFAIYSLAFVFANSITALAVLILGLLIIFVSKAGVCRGIIYTALVFWTIILLSVATKAIEVPSEHGLTDKFLFAKLDRITRSLYPDISVFSFGLEYQGDIRSLTARLDQNKMFLDRELFSGSNAEKKITGMLLGNFNYTEYKKYDSQYLNFWVNSGSVSALMFICIFSVGVFEGFKSWLRYRKDIMLAFSVFILSMLVLGFTGAAFLNRFPLNFILYLSLGIIFLEKDRNGSVYAG